jgi:hypothetical protein
MNEILIQAKMCMCKPQSHYAKWNKEETKSHVHDSVYMKGPILKDLRDRKQISGCQKLWGVTA